MRLARGLLALGGATVLAACSSGPGKAPEKAAGDDHIACALGGAKDFSNACAVERTEKDGTLYLTVRHPDGAFRRFEVVKDGRGVVLAAGADQAQVSLAGDMLEVKVGADRYRFPATLKNHEPNP